MSPASPSAHPIAPPRRENCQFFALAAQAESAGFRPCLRCRPELAPASAAGASDALLPWSTQDASLILASLAPYPAILQPQLLT